MGNTEKGTRGFIAINESDRKTKRISTYLTPGEAKKFKDYLKKNDLVMTDFLRDIITKL
tara:strand:+ start:1578 stop:1754 length:177 start_codon:yes stop_codon:yes gene_type:complete